MRDLRVQIRLTDFAAKRLVAALAAVALLLMLSAGSDVRRSDPASAARPDTPKQQSGSAKGRPHLVSPAQATVKQAGPRQAPMRPKKAPPLERPYKPQVVKDTKAVRPGPPPPRKMPRTAPLKVTGFDAAKSVEDPTQRTRYGYRYRNPDGTWTARENTRPVNYRAPDGSWQPIDPSLVRADGGRWRNKADETRVDLADRATGQDLAVIDLGQGKRFGFGVQGSEPVVGQAQGDKIDYRSLRQDSELRLRVLNGGSLKEDIVLRSAQAPSEWEFPLRTEGVSPRLATDGSIELVDGTGAVTARIPHAFMVDSKIDPRSGDAARSDAVSYSLEPRNGQWVLHVSADRTWLGDPARVYPVTIDPTAVWNYGDTHDTYVQTGYGSSPYAEAEVKAGTYNGGSTKAATYLAFTQVDNELAHSTIYDVNLNLFNYWSYSCKDTPVSVHGVTQQWAQSDIASYPGPKYGSALTSRSFANGFIAEGASTSACPAKWQSIDLGSPGNALVQGWVNGSKPNYGLTVRASTTSSSGWKKFGSRESPNGPYLVITYSPYNAAYAFAENPVKVDPPVLNNQAGYVNVKVTNKGHDVWTAAAGYRLSYGVFDKSGNQIYHVPAETTMPQTVSYNETVTIKTKINPLPPGTWTIKFNMINTTSGAYVDFAQWGVPRTAVLRLTVPDVPSQLTEMFPKNNYVVGTLRPQLFAEAQTVDAWPSANVTYQFTLCAPPWINWEWCENSPWQQTPKWTLPAGKLQWNKEYYWNVRVNDGGGSTTDGPWYKLVTGVQQPAITSHLASPAAARQDFDHQAGNYTTTVTDVAVASAGPPLLVVRTYNSLDPRASLAFGAGWSTRFDMKVVPDNDGSGNVVITYPDGQQVRFARNTNGSFTPPPGRQATFATVTGGGWKLMDKESTGYAFDANGRLFKVTDHRGRAQDLQYGTDGKLTKVTVTGGRSLTFTWSGTHVATVSTDPVGGTPMTWSYSYTGDTLTKVCPPTTTTECTTYDYGTGSHYRSAVLDDNPVSYWRFNEASGGILRSSVAENLGTDNGGATNVTLGQTGALAGTADKAARFSGSQSRVRMPDRYISREGGFLTVEAWFKTTGKGVILSYQNAQYGNAATKFTPALYVGVDGKLRGQFWNGSAANVLTSAGTVNNGQWHHAVLSGQGSTQTLYLDGSVAGTLAGTIDHLNSPYVYIGSGHTSASWKQTPSTSGWFDFTGDIDEVAIYDKPLGLPAVQDHYAARLAAQQLTKATKPSGRVQAVNVYDVGNDRLGNHTDDRGGTWQIGTPVYSGKIDDLERTITLTDPRSGTIRYVYEPLRGNRLISETDQLGKSTTYGYDTNGQLAKITDRNGNETNLWFDERGNKRYEQRCADADTCHAQFWNYYLNSNDPFDPRNDQMTQRLDGRTINPYASPYTTVWEYDAYGQQVSETWPPTDDYPFRGIGYTYTDGTEPAEGGGTQPAGLLKRRGKGDGGTAATYTYTSSGDVAKMTDAAGKVTTYQYDALGRVIGMTETSDAHPGGVTTTHGYDGRGRVNRVTGPAVRNEISDTTHTSEKRLTYDADGNIATEKLVDLTGGDAEEATSNTYDAHGLAETVTDAEGGKQTFGYDSTGARTSMTDPRGARFTFGYTARGELATRTLTGWTGNPNAPGPATDVVLDSYAYDPGGRLASHADAMGRTTGYTYYGDDRLAQTIGKNLRLNGSATPRDAVLESRSYDGAGHLTSLVIGGTQRTDYEYDQTGQLKAETVDPGGAARRADYAFDPDNNVIRVVRSGEGSEQDEVTSFAYDQMDQVVRQAVENGDTDLVTTYTRDQHEQITKVVDPRGNIEGATAADYTTTNRYDLAGQLVETAAPPVQVERGGGTVQTLRPTTRFGYDTAGSQTHVTDPEGRTTTTGYDKAGRQTLVALPSYTPPGGSAITPKTSLRYDEAGQLTERTDERGNTTRFRYDDLGRLVRLEEPQLENEDHPGAWLADYDLAGEQLSVTDPIGARNESTYDDLGRQITTTEVERHPVPAAYTTKLGYDDAGSLISRTRPAGDTTGYTINGAGDVTALTDPLAQTTAFEYDVAGRLIKITDPLGKSTVTELDPAGRQIQTRDLDASGTTLRSFGFGYDAAGDQISETSPEGRTSRRFYDALGRITKLTEPVSGTATIETTFGYDAAGRRTRLTDGRGNSTITTYNSLGLPESTIDPPTATHNDLASRMWTTAYDAAGNAVQEAKPGGVSATLTFDELNRLTKETGTGAAATTQERRLGYDLAGRLTRVSRPSEDLRYTYNDRGQPLTSVGPDDKTSQFSYDPNGRLTQRTDPAGQTTLTWNGADQILTTSDDMTGGTATRGYDDGGRLTSITIQSGQPGAPSAHRLYDYDDLDRITKDELKSPTGTLLASVAYAYDRDDELKEKTTAGTTGAGRNTYDYDDAGRLTKWTAPSGTATTYGWDAAGNRTKAGATTYTYDERNRLTSDGTNAYTYSSRGTLDSRGGIAYQFDAFDRLTQAGSAQYGYDGLDRMATRADSSGMADFNYATQDNDITAVLDGGGTLTTGYERAPDGDVLSVRQNGQSYRAYSDRHQDLTALLDPGATQLTGSVAFDPFGRRNSAVGASTPLGYQGEYTDSDNGNVNMHARWYTPSTGNFISRDDWMPNPDPSIVANRYVYGGGAPLDQTDPSGHCFDPFGLLCPHPDLPLPRRCPGWAFGPCGGGGGGQTAPPGNNYQPRPGCGGRGYCGYPNPNGDPGNDPQRVPNNGPGGRRHCSVLCLAPIIPPVAVPSLAEIQAALAIAARDTFAPRPPTKPGLNQKQLDKIRDRTERTVRIINGLNNAKDIVDRLDPRNAHPDTNPAGNDTGPGKTDDENCNPVKHYGPLDNWGRPTGIYARFCDPSNLKGGTKADPSIFPPGFPGLDASGRSTNPKDASGNYKYARCHLLGKQLGGSGDRADNLATCLQRPVNTPNQRNLENQVKKAVRDHQDVDYWVLPTYRRGNLTPDAFRLIARGRRPDGSPGINIDKCLLNRANGKVRDGNYCRP